VVALSTIEAPSVLPAPGRLKLVLGPVGVMIVTLVDAAPSRHDWATL
jgi:hypothetical protein